MRIALWDIVQAQRERLRPLLAPADEIVDIPDAPPAPVEVDVVIASRFAARDQGRARFRLLQAAGAGTDKIDFAALPDEAWVCNAYEHEGPIAEYVFAAMLDHAVGFGALTRAIPERGWGQAYFSRQPHGELSGKTLGLVGLGHIGKAVARRAKAFDMTRDGGGRAAARQRARRRLDRHRRTGSASSSSAPISSSSPVRSTSGRAA